MEGLAGWLAIAAAVVVADVVAIRRGNPTLSAMFAKHRGWAIPAWAAVTAHLMLGKP